MKNIKKRHRWTEEDIKNLIIMHNNNMPLNKIAETFGLSYYSIQSKITELHLDSGDIHYKNSVNFKAEYQDYDWCFDKYITQNMSYDDISNKYGYSKRVIQKWCSEKFNINKNTYHQLKKINEKQKELIKYSMLGDGHICKRDHCFIVSHARNQKDYLYWKYDILKDLCKSEPYIIDGENNNWSGFEEYPSQDQFKFNTRRIDDIEEIGNIKLIDIISELNEFGLSIHMLDDGSKNGKSWCLCLAEYTDDEKNKYIQICKNKFHLNCHLLKDERYLLFDVVSSKVIDDIILRNIPNNLDIIQYKILDKR